jgi:HEAT repeat protein
MANTDLKLKALEALVHLHTAIKKVQLYPDADLTLTNGIEMLYLHLLEIVKNDSPAVFAELEKNAPSIENRPSESTIHILSLLDILRGMNIKNIAFENDPANEELRVLVNLIANRPSVTMASGQEDVLSDISIEKLTEGADPESELKGLTDSDQVTPAGSETAPETATDATAAAEPEKEQTASLAPETDLDHAPETMAPVKTETEQETPPTPKTDLDHSPETTAQAKIEAEQETPPVSKTTENDIAERIAKMQKIFTRLNVMEGAIEALPSEDNMRMIERSSQEVAQWIKKGHDTTPFSKNIYSGLQTLLQDFIKFGYFTDAFPMISALAESYPDAPPKQNEAYVTVLRSLTSESNINLLLKNVNQGEQNKVNEAFRILVACGDLALRPLLSKLRNVESSKERISILHVIRDMGHRAIPAIKERITIDAPWYYLRNMAYLLGHIGNEDSVEVLRPLILHKEKRVNREALKSISQTGGGKRGELLLSVLPQVDQDMKLRIIEMLGKMKFAEAVPTFRDMLKNKSSLSRDEFVAMQEKICSALGNIGSADAVKILSEIAESKSILGIGSYSKEVKHAAEHALSYIKKRR